MAYGHQKHCHYISNISYRTLCPILRIIPSSSVMVMVVTAGDRALSVGVKVMISLSSCSSIPSSTIVTSKHDSASLAGITRLEGRGSKSDVEENKKENNV